MSVRENLVASKQMLEEQILLLVGKPQYEGKVWKMRKWVLQIQLKLESIPADHTDKGDFWNEWIS